MTLAVLVSPGAGGGRGERVGAALVARWRQLGHDVVVLAGDDAAGAGRAAAALVSGGPDPAPRPEALVVVGGDGALQLGASALAGSGVALALVPVGSGNDAARSLGVRRLSRGDLTAPGRPGGPADAVHRALRERRTRAVDLLHVTPGRADGAPAPTGPLGGEGPGGVGPGGVGPGSEGSGGGGRWVVGVVAAGFDAAVNARANRWAGQERSARRPVTLLPPRARYVAAVLRELPGWRPRGYRLVVDGAAGPRRAVLVAVAGTTSYGGGLRIAPGARPDDALADVVVVGPLGRLSLLAVLPTVFGGWHVHHPAVSTTRGRVVEIGLVDGGPPVLAHGDGEPLGPLPLRVEVVPGALTLLVT